MTTKQAWILAGVAGAVVALGYLATKREVHATVDVGDGVAVTYTSRDSYAEGAEGAPTAIVDSHRQMMELIERSERAIKAHDAAEAVE